MTSTTRKPRFQSLSAGWLPKKLRLAERQAVPPKSKAPPRMIFHPMGLVGGPCGSVTNPPGKGSSRSLEAAEDFFHPAPLDSAIRGKTDCLELGATVGIAPRTDVIEQKTSDF